MKYIFSAFCTSVLVFNANASNPDEYYQNFFWMPTVSLSVDSVQDGVVDDYVGYAFARVTFPGSGSYTLLDKYCKDDSVLEQPKGDSTYWVQLYSAEQQDPQSKIRFRIEFDDPRWTFPSNGSHIDGWTTKVSQALGIVYPGPSNQCWSIGQTTGVVMPGSLNRQLKLKVSIPRADSRPGEYVFSAPVKWMFEERKYNNESGFAPPGGALHLEAAQKLQQYGVTSYIQIPVVINSKCNFDTSPINLSHGTMTGRNADGNQTKPYNLNVTCTPGTSLSVKLLGTQKVSGKTDNYTQCGTGGMCELTFDNGKYDETMTVDSSKTLSIKSTYRLNDIAKPVAESFEGSGVLQVLVN
ncbi:hypothetical protein G8G26_004871 [Escherichia coli]|nr:hypothetical protein [Escherichia coli]